MNKYQTYFINIYPELKDIFISVTPVSKLNKQDIPIPEALTKIVISQMLSRNAALSIYSKLQKQADLLEKQGTWLLSDKVMRKAGVSQRKIRTIIEFSQKYNESPKKYEDWRNLNKKQLFEEVSQNWGMSNWTAAMLGIFYLGIEDIYPSSDASINKVENFLNLQFQNFHKKDKKKPIFDPGLAKPYRSYLALYMWKFIDEKII